MDMFSCFWFLHALIWCVRYAYLPVVGLFFAAKYSFTMLVCVVFQELDKIVMYELKTGGVLLHPIFGGGKEKDKYV